MANVLYGINGEGSGHWTRSREVIEYLKKIGHEVTIITSGRGVIGLGPLFDIEEIAGFRFKFIEGRIDKSSTLWENTMSLPRFGKSFRKVVDLITTRRISHVITDFEPISCFVGNLKGLPVFSIDNMHTLIRTDADFPPGYAGKAEVARAVISIMTPGAKIYFALSFFPTMAIDAKTMVFPPILRKTVYEVESLNGDYAVVYLSGGFGSIAEELSKIDYRFVVYGGDREEIFGNVSFKKFDEASFLKDLAGASCVIGTAGFSLISEALHLGKPYLASPVSGQFEQVFNAFHVDRLGYGKMTERLHREAIESFLSNLQLYHQSLDSYPIHSNLAILNKISDLLT